MSRCITVCALIIFGLTSCQPVLKMIYGVKKPKPKTDVEVIEYSKKVFDNEYEMYRPVDEDARKALVKMGLNSAPDIIFFDSEGGQKSIHADTLQSCTASADSFITQLDLLDDAPQMELKKSDILRYLNKINFKDKQKEDRIYKYSIIILWADWIGPKLNREKTDDWVKVYHELDKKSQDEIDLIIVNMDLLEGADS